MPNMDLQRVSERHLGNFPEYQLWNAEPPGLAIASLAREPVQLG